MKLIKVSGPIGGDGRTVEIDERHFYRAKYKLGRVLSTAHIPNRKAETLRPIVQSKFLPGTTIVSDCWRAYNTLTTMRNEYGHLVVNHRLNFVNRKEPAGHTQNIENLWRWIKRKF
ncbi:hypothetical protein RF11_08615 [Thelohanellus kitauei]|uniref:ISXO2-like transposase domain-containing protein n=1 Tax=Thelohanellus kitauei TaxID=669202 RepID=A0A0C2MYA8_THEKT|nr:hypothetical protein RF11_08615 [Thelohanellus kitauei]